MKNWIFNPGGQIDQRDFDEKLKFVKSSGGCKMMLKVTYDIIYVLESLQMWPKNILWILISKRKPAEK